MWESAPKRPLTCPRRRLELDAPDVWRHLADYAAASSGHLWTPGGILDQPAIRWQRSQVIRAEMAAIDAEDAERARREATRGR